MDDTTVPQVDNGGLQYVDIGEGLCATPSASPSTDPVREQQ